MKTYLTACALFALAIASQGQDVAALMAKGDALDAKLQNKQALEAYQAAEKSDPKNVALLCCISRQYGLMMDDVTANADKQAFGEKALGYAKQAVALDDKSATAHLSVAVCCGRLAPL